MEKITTFEPDVTCPELANKLVPFFQTVDLELSTTELVDNFIVFLQVNGLAVIGRPCTVTIESAKDITREELENWKANWGKNFLEPLTIIHDDKIRFDFPPVCRHVEQKMLE